MKIEVRQVTSDFDFELILQAKSLKTSPAVGKNAEKIAEVLHAAAKTVSEILEANHAPTRA